MMMMMILGFLLIATVCGASGSTGVLFTYNSNAYLRCTNDSAKNVSFYKNTTAGGSISRIVADSSKYVINSTTLTILTIKKADLDYSYFCNYSSTTVYFVNQVAPYLYQVDQSLVTTIEEYDSTFGCYLFVGDKSTVSWTWSKTDGTKLINNSRVSWTNSTGDSQLTITRAQLDDNGKYNCTVTNPYGSHSRITDLKIKSKLAPIWPLIGFIVEMALLALIILSSYLWKKSRKLD